MTSLGSFHYLNACRASNQGISSSLSRRRYGWTARSTSDGDGWMLCSRSIWISKMSITTNLMMKRILLEMPFTLYLYNLYISELDRITTKEARMDTELKTALHDMLAWNNKIETSVESIQISVLCKMQLIRLRLCYSSEPHMRARCQLEGILFTLKYLV